MENHCFIEITEEFRGAHEGTRTGCNVFTTSTTKTGVIVISLNAVNEFPALFIGQEDFMLHWLSETDFPQQKMK